MVLIVCNYNVELKFGGTMSNSPSLEEMRAWHQEEADKISDAIRRGDADHLRVSNGAFAKEFEKLSAEDFRKQAKKRLHDLNRKYSSQSIEP